MNTHKSLLKTLSLTLSLSFAPSCWDAPPDDAGDEAFVAWATVAVMGRRPYSSTEVEVLADLAQAEGRGVVLDALMEQPEYLDYWSRVLIDHLRVPREDEHAPPDPTCFTEARLATTQYDELVHHLRFATWRSQFCPDGRLGSFAAVATRRSSSTLDLSPFQADDGSWDYEGVDRTVDALAATAGPVLRSPVVAPTWGGLELTSGVEMDPSTQALPLAPGRGSPSWPSCESFTVQDALRAGLAEDRMDAVLRVGLVPLGIFNTTDAHAAGELARTYLGRDPACVECHTTHYSTTDPLPRNLQWDRFEPAHRVDLEGTAFSWSDGAGYHYGGDGGAEVTDHLIDLFRGDQFQVAAGRHPFGIDGACVTQDGRVGLRDPVPSVLSRTTAFAGLYGSTIGVGALIDQFAIGADALAFDALEVGPVPALDGVVGDPVQGADLAANSCAGCHQDEGWVNAPPDLVEQTRGLTAHRLYDIILSGSSAQEMDPVGISPANAAHVVAYYTSLPGHESNLVYDEPATAFAHLAAMSLVDAVYEEMTGASLVMAHGYPRNAEAAATLEVLTRTLIDGGWSLRAVIRRIALSNLANRRAPADSTADGYELPMIAWPLADVNEHDPLAPEASRVTGHDSNGQGDLVHRWSIPSLLLQVEHALLWPSPPLFAADDDATYADLPFQRDVGAFVSHRNEGTHELGLGALLAWEVEVATCRNPGDSPDLIDLLVAAEPALTLEQAMLAVKGRLVSDGVWWDATIDGDGGDDAFTTGPQERTLAAQLALAPLDGPASADPEGLRDFCAAVLRSPEFLLAGLPAWEAGQGPPDADPDLPCVDPVCGRERLCEHWSEAARSAGYEGLDCDARADDFTLR